MAGPPAHKKPSEQSDKGTGNPPITTCGRDGRGKLSVSIISHPGHGHPKKKSKLITKIKELSFLEDPTHPSGFFCSKMTGGMFGFLFGASVGGAHRIKTHTPYESFTLLKKCLCF